MQTKTRKKTKTIKFDLIYEKIGNNINYVLRDQQDGEVADVCDCCMPYYTFRIPKKDELISNIPCERIIAAITLIIPKDSEDKEDNSQIDEAEVERYKRERDPLTGKFKKNHIIVNVPSNDPFANKDACNHETYLLLTTYGKTLEFYSFLTTLFNEAVAVLVTQAISHKYGFTVNKFH